MAKAKIKVGFEGHAKDLEVTVPEGEPVPWGLDTKFSVVGTDVPRIDGALKVSGRAKYTYDQHPRGMLWGKVLHAPTGAAAIKSLDLTAVKAMKGVRAVYEFPRMKEHKTIRFHGDEILAVAAETEELAEEALRAVKIEFDRRPVATTIADGMKKDAPMVFEGEGNVKAGRTSGDKDKAQKAIAGAYKTIEATYETQVQTHSALEPHGTLAVFEKDGSLTCYVSTQGTFNCKADAVKFSGLPDNKVRVVAQMVGGGFGAKFSIAASGQAAIALAKETGRPVKIMLTREGEHTTGGNRPGSQQQMRAGVAKDGKILGYNITVHGTAGVAQGGAGAANPAIYSFGDSWKTEATVLTNGGPATAFRSPSWPQGNFAMEGFLDEIAHAIGMDPLDLRRRNIEDEVYLAQWTLGAEKIGWSRRNQKAGAGSGVLRRGIGMASSSWQTMGGPECEVDVVIHSDGAVEAKNGAQDIGTGTRTLMAIIAAEELGVKPAAIRVSLGDTTWPIGPGSGGSKTAPTIGPATRTAAWKAKGKLLALAAAKLGVAAESLRVENGTVTDGAGKSMTFADACRLIPTKKPISERGVRLQNYEAYMKRVHGAQFAEVEVDTETGNIRVVKVVTIQDAGQVINKLLFESQLVGGVIQGMSYALYENRVLDARYGTQMNADLMMYKITGAKDMPEIEPIAFEVANGGNNCSMMGLGEPPNIPTASAIGNAFFNATGVRLRSLPMTPDKVIAALEQARRKGVNI